MQAIDGADQLGRAVRVRAEDLAEVGEIGGVGVRDGEVERAGFGADGDVVAYLAREFRAVLADQ